MSISTFLRRFSTKDQSPLLPLTSLEASASTSYVTAASSPMIRSASTMTSVPPTHQDTFLALSREEEHLQLQLQSLIDAQSEGLLAGLANADAHETSSATGSSRTPTSESTGPSSKSRYATTASVVVAEAAFITPVRQPPRKKTSLQGARRGIARAIDALSLLKAQEGAVLSSALSQKDEEIELVHRLGHKEQGLEAQIRDIQDEAPSRRIQDCKREERALEAEIREVETKLWGLKSRHGHLLREIEQLENGVQAKLSSYRAALVLAKGETKAFLQHRQGSGGGGSAGGHYNAAVATRGGGGKGGRGTKEIGIWTLPAERRTLAMADEHFREEQEDLRARGQAAEQERLALEEGGLVWRDVVAEVTAVEDMLRTEMHGPEAEGRTTREEQQQQQQQLSLGNNEEAHDEGGEREGEEQRRGEKGGSSGGGGRRRDHGDSTKRVLRRMQHAKTALGEHLATAERRHWRLLVCCVGAELEALAEGMEVLTGGWDGGGGGEEGLKGGWDGGGEERLKRGWEEDDDDGGGGGGGGEEDLKRGWEGDDDGGDDGEGRLKRGWEGDDDDDDDDDDDGEGAGVEGDPGSGGERSEKGAGEENVFESVDRHGGFAAWG